MSDVDLSTVMADGDVLQRTGDALVGVNLEPRFDAKLDKTGGAVTGPITSTGAITTSNGLGLAVEHVGTPTKLFSPRVKLWDTDQAVYVTLENNGLGPQLRVRNVIGDAVVTTVLNYVGTTGDLNLSGVISVTVPAPTAAGHAATKGYVDTAVAALVQGVNAQTGTAYTLVAADAGKLITLSNAGAVTLTVPQDSAATIAVGTYVDLLQLGAGQVTVAAGTGATLRVSGLTAKARAQYSRLGVQKVAANTWSLFGDLAAT
jgi:hypothetical protein